MVKATILDNAHLRPNCIIGSCRLSKTFLYISHQVYSGLITMSGNTDHVTLCVLPCSTLNLQFSSCQMFAVSSRDIILKSAKPHPNLYQAVGLKFAAVSPFLFFLSWLLTSLFVVRFYVCRPTINTFRASWDLGQLVLNLRSFCSWIWIGVIGTSFVTLFTVLHLGWACRLELVTS